MATDRYCTSMFRHLLVTPAINGGTGLPEDVIVKVTTESAVGQPADLIGGKLTALAIPASLDKILISSTTLTNIASGAIDTADVQWGTEEAVITNPESVCDVWLLAQGFRLDWQTSESIYAKAESDLGIGFGMKQICEIRYESSAANVDCGGVWVQGYHDNVIPVGNIQARVSCAGSGTTNTAAMSEGAVFLMAVLPDDEEVIIPEPDLLMLGRVMFV